MQNMVLSRLMRVPSYQESRSHIFSSVGSIDWFIRQHRRELIEANAMFLVRGSWSVDPEAFDAYVLDAGSRAAKVHAEGLAA